MKTLPRLELIWLALLLMTAATWFAGERGGGGFGVVVLVLALAVAKGLLVALDFMELRHAPVLWRRLVGGWIVFVVALIVVAYRLGK